MSTFENDLNMQVTFATCNMWDNVFQSIDRIHFIHPYLATIAICNKNKKLLMKLINLGSDITRSTIFGSMYYNKYSWFPLC